MNWLQTTENKILLAYIENCKKQATNNPRLVKNVVKNKDYISKNIPKIEKYLLLGIFIIYAAMAASMLARNAIVLSYTPEGEEIVTPDKRIRLARYSILGLIIFLTTAVYCIIMILNL
jgi:hypothetical protein